MPDEAEVLDVVREYLQRPEGQPLGDLLSGDLVRRAEILDSVTKHYAIVRQDVEIRELRLLEQDGSAARVACDARIRIERMELADQSVPFVDHIDLLGPVTLRHVSERWLIEDLPRRGLSIRSTFRLYDDLAFDIGDFQLRPLLLTLQHGGLHLIAEIRNARPAEAHVTAAQLLSGGWRTRRQLAHLRGETRVPQGRATRVDAAFRIRSRMDWATLDVEFVIASDLSDPVHAVVRVPGLDQPHAVSDRIVRGL